MNKKSYVDYIILS